MGNTMQEAEIIASNAHPYHRESETPDTTTSSIAGCLRGTIGFTGGSILAVGGGIGIGIQYGVGLGILTGIALFVVFICLAIYLINNAKQLTILDCFLPIPVGLMSAVLFAPISLAGMSIFSSATCLAASLFLTIMLLMYRTQKITGGWLILPFLVFIYELLPIEFPSDIDNFLAFGGNATNLILAWTFPGIGHDDNNELE